MSGKKGKSKKKSKKSKKKIRREDALKLVKKFSERAVEEFGPFIKSIAVYGSYFKEKEKKTSDIDVLVLVDNASFEVDKKAAAQYRLMLAKMMEKFDKEKKLHVNTVTLTSFWDGFRAGDPIVLHILRSGEAIVDTGFFGPLQMLLKAGRVKPSPEAIAVYYARGDRFVEIADNRIKDAVYDLYWAMIDSAYATVLATGKIPSEPEEITKDLKKFVDKRWLGKTYLKSIKRMQRLAKKIEHKKVDRLKIKDLKKARKDAIKFIKRMKKIGDKLL